MDRSRRERVDFLAQLTGKLDEFRTLRRTADEYLESLYREREDLDSEIEDVQVVVAKVAAICESAGLDDEDEEHDVGRDADAKVATDTARRANARFVEVEIHRPNRPREEKASNETKRDVAGTDGTQTKAQVIDELLEAGPIAKHLLSARVKERMPECSIQSIRSFVSEYARKGRIRCVIEDGEVVYAIGKEQTPERSTFDNPKTIAVLDFVGRGDARRLDVLGMLQTKHDMTYSQADGFINSLKSLEVIETYQRSSKGGRFCRPGRRATERAPRDEAEVEEISEAINDVVLEVLKDGPFVCDDLPEEVHLRMPQEPMQTIRYAIRELVRRRVIVRQYDGKERVYTLATDAPKVSDDIAEILQEHARKLGLSDRSDVVRYWAKYAPEPCLSDRIRTIVITQGPIDSAGITERLKELGLDPDIERSNVQALCQRNVQSGAFQRIGRGQYIAKGIVPALKPGARLPVRS